MPGKASTVQPLQANTESTELGNGTTYPVEVDIDPPPPYCSPPPPYPGPPLTDTTDNISGNNGVNLHATSTRGTFVKYCILVDSNIKVCLLMIR